MTLPNFLVIGAYKSGTTSLHNYLKQHPDIFIPEVKEPNYFAFANVQPLTTNPAYKRSIITEEDYKQLFERAENKKAIGEVSPEYMSSLGTAKIIHSRLPNVKLIAILRNPVERAYSDYLMYVHANLEKESNFSKALSKQEDRMSRGDPTGFYVHTGFYGKQLTEYYKLFPKKQIKVFLFEDMTTNLSLLLRTIYCFLEVDPNYLISDLTRYNHSGVPRNTLAKFIIDNKKHIKKMFTPILTPDIRAFLRRYKESLVFKPVIPADTKAMLQEIYQDDIHQLEMLIGRDLSNWVR